MLVFNPTKSNIWSRSQQVGGQPLVVVVLVMVASTVLGQDNAKPDIRLGDPQTVLRRREMGAAIDREIGAQVAQQGGRLAAKCTDEEFIRRAFLDINGITPSPVEVREFSADTNPEKRELLVQSLLSSPRYATHMANIWRNWMLPTGQGIENLQSAVGVHEWLRKKFRDNTRYDQMVSDLLIATQAGREGPALYFTSLEVKPEKLAASTARLFLGIQIECAQCHNHPFEQWKQEDFWGYAAFFARLRGGTPGAMEGLTDGDSGEVTLPDSDTVIAPRYPGGEPADPRARGSRRQQLAIWMASSDNPFLAKAGANRVWALLFGRGIVEPLDDLSPNNVPSHPELLGELARFFAESGFDLRELIAAICVSEAYQRGSAADFEAAPESFAMKLAKPLTPEQLYDSLSVLLDRRPEQRIPGLNLGADSDPRRLAFIGKMRTPTRNPSDYSAGVLQALTLLNGSESQEITDEKIGVLVGALAAPWMSNQERTDSVYLAILARLPTSKEREQLQSHLAEALVGLDEAAKQEEATSQFYGDVVWALINSAEFAFNH